MLFLLGKKLDKSFKKCFKSGGKFHKKLLLVARNYCFTLHLRELVLIFLIASVHLYHTKEMLRCGMG